MGGTSGIGGYYKLETERLTSLEAGDTLMRTVRLEDLAISLRRKTERQAKS